MASQDSSSSVKIKVLLRDIYSCVHDNNNDNADDDE